jgi:hypothetical protein
LSCRDVLGEDVLSLIREVVVGLVHARTRHVGGCINRDILDLLKRRERGGLKALALELRWLLRWYWPVGLRAMASWFT